jgi:tripartite-type tricarboxylate transporter receptor subunit TctC
VAPWFGIVVPAGTPQPIVNRISGALETALACRRFAKGSTLPDVRRKVHHLESSPTSLNSTVALGAKVVRDAGIPPD